MNKKFVKVVKSYWVLLILLFIIFSFTEANAKDIKKGNPVKHFRSNKSFIKGAINLNRKELAEVKKNVITNDIDGAWVALIKHFSTRKKLIDPIVERWSKDNDKAFSEKLLKKLLRKDYTQEFIQNKKINWSQNKMPARKDYEKYWIRNRLPFLVRFVRIANELNKSDIRKLSAGIFLDWFKQCPPPKLPVKSWYDKKVEFSAWREIEVGMRGRHLVSIFMATRHWKDVPADFHRSLLLSIQQNMDYLVSHFAKVGICKGNHQAHHAHGLIAAGVLFPELKSSALWKRIGLKLVKAHLENDNDKEGVQKEHSPSYHLEVAKLYFDPYELLNANQQKISEWMKNGIFKMLSFVLYSTAPDGRLVTLNDCFPHISKGLRERAAKAFNRPDLLAIEHGRKGKSPLLDHSFKTAGMAFMRSSWKNDAVFVVLDASSHGSPHWHAGKPNFVIHAGNQLLACDPQLGSYDDPSFWKYFRQAKGHNTVLVDGEGDGTPKNFWYFKHISKPKITTFKSNEKIALVKAMTDGFKRMKPSVTFSRRLLYVKPNLIFIEDTLNSKGEHTYEWLLHLVPQAPVVDKTVKSMMTNLGGAFELVCTPLQDDVSGPTIRQGKYKNLTIGMSEGRGKYWVAPAKGQAPTLLANAPYGVWKQKSKGKVKFHFVLQVLSKGQKPISKSEALKIEKKALGEINK